MQLGHGPLLVLKVMITGTFLLKKDMYIKNFGFTNHQNMLYLAFCYFVYITEHFVLICKLVSLCCIAVRTLICAELEFMNSKSSNNVM